MATAKITGPGLAAIAVCVTALWGCWIGERLMLQRAVGQQIQALHELELLRSRYRSRPVSEPLQPGPPRKRAAEG